MILWISLRVSVNLIDCVGYSKVLLNSGQALRHSRGECTIYREVTMTYQPINGFVVPLDLRMLEVYCLIHFKNQHAYEKRAYFKRFVVINNM